MYTPRHFDERAAEAALDRLEAGYGAAANDPGIPGIQARLMVAGLRPLYLALIKEVNAGATAGDLRKALAGFVSNIVLTHADTYSAREPVARAAHIVSFLEELGFCLSRQIAMPGGVESVLGQKGGRA